MATTQAGQLDLTGLRQEIDQVDLELVRLLDRRMRVVEEIGQAKGRAGVAVIDPGREQAVLTRAKEEASRLGGIVSAQDVDGIFGAVIRASRNKQRRSS